MRPLLGIVADDLTGAADTGVAFLAGGLSAVVSWPGRDVERAWDQPADVVAVDTRSRVADARSARRITAEVVSAFRQGGVGTLYKKVDSMLRGHVGDELRAAIDAWHPGSLAVVAPAFPSAGRTTVGGRQVVDGVPIAQSASVPALLEQAGISIRHADLTCVRSVALRSTLNECRDRVVGAVVCDAETDEDLRAIARAGAQLRSALVWVGSGGLARAMAADLGSASHRVRPAVIQVSGPILLVVGSRSRVARAQADHIAAAGVRRVVVPVAALARGAVASGAGCQGADIGHAIASHLRAGEDVLVTLGGEPGEAGADDPRLTARLGELVRPCAPAVAGLILTGGDTAVGVLQAWGTSALRLVEEIDTGVVLSETIGARAVPIVTKAGSFGDRGTITRARERLRKQG